jgi:hypothetical protein
VAVSRRATIIAETNGMKAAFGMICVAGGGGCKWVLLHWHYSPQMIETVVTTSTHSCACLTPTMRMPWPEGTKQ